MTPKLEDQYFGVRFCSHEIDGNSERSTTFVAVEINIAAGAPSPDSTAHAPDVLIRKRNECV